jgi:hypothetical protein
VQQGQWQSIPAAPLLPQSGRFGGGRIQLAGAALCCCCQEPQLAFAAGERRRRQQGHLSARSELLNFLNSW